MNARTPDPARRVPVARGATTATESSVAVGTMVMNITTYGFTMLTARIVGPGEYGAFVAALNLLIVIQVVALGLQATAARRIASEPMHVAAVEASILAVTVKVSLGLGLLLLLLTPATDRLLNLDSLTTAALIALAAVPLTLAGGQMGILQGERRWRALGLVYVMGGIPRLVVGLALILAHPSSQAALGGVALGYLFPVAAGWWALRERRTASAGTEQHSVAALLRESLHNSQALFPYFALTTVDIVVARHVLSEHDAGLYASGLIMTKAMFFLPQFVVIIAFPEMATRAGGNRALFRSLRLVLGIGAAATLAAWLLADLAMIFVGGAAFAEVKSRLWLFAVLGTVLSMVQLLVYSVLARQDRASILPVWLALALLAAAGAAVSTLSGLVLTALIVNASLMAVLMYMTLRRSERPPGVEASGVSSRP